MREWGGSTPLIVSPISIEDDKQFNRTLTFDKTWQEVHDALENGTPCYLRYILARNVCDVDNLSSLSPTMFPIVGADDNDGYYVVVMHSNDMLYLDAPASSAPLTIRGYCGNIA